MPRLLRLFRRGVAALFVLAAALLLGAWLIARDSLPRLEGSVRLPGLGARVEVRRDSRGVPHIQAASEGDAAAAVGFVHAQDRFFQMDLARRIVAGRLAEVAGPAALAVDRRSRTLQLGRTAADRLVELRADELALLEAYARGVNAGLADTGRPVECQLLRYTPEPWQPLDSLLALEYMELLLTSDGGERDRAEVAAAVGAELASYLLDFQGLVGATILPPGVDEAKDATPGVGDPAPVPVPDSGPGPRDPAVGERRPQPGSNGWVVAGSRTRSGKPLLANDTHLPASVPSLLYQAHVAWPGADVVGMTLPGQPFVVLGHNGRVGWGATTLVADQIDWVRLELSPDRSSYRGPEGMEPFERREEIIRVKGAEPITLAVLWSRFGPVSDGIQAPPGQAFARAWTGYLGNTTLRAVRAFATVASVEQFLAAAQGVTGPDLNLIAADVDGHIGWLAAAALPDRGLGDGRFPVAGSRPGAGISGWLPAAAQLSLLDPPQGYIVTANNQVGTGPRARLISGDWAMPFRAERITELIRARTDHDVAAQERIQGDARSELARAIVAVLPPSPLRDARAERARSWLASWDGSYLTGPEPALFERFRLELQRALFEDQAGLAWQRAELGLLKALGAREFRSVPPTLGATDHFDDLRSAERETRAAVIEQALLGALDSLAGSHGEAPEGWSWEKIHMVAFPHPLGRLPMVGRWLDLPPRPVRGGGETVCVNDARSSQDFRVSHVAAFRMVLDFADLAASRVVNSTGQSGHPLSPWYADQVPAWARVESYPMWYAPSDVAAQSRYLLRLEP